MKPNYYVRRVNSPFDDSGIFVRNVYMPKAFLFDCGRLGNVDNTELNNISYVFVSHTHIDHFSGFDRFLRTTLLSNNTIKFFGPKGFINNVRGKIAGYTWNLIRDYNVTFIAIELTEDNVYGAKFAARNGFIEEQIDIKKEDLLEDGFSLDYEFFDHGITSIGYRIKEPFRVSINKDKLKEYGFLEGAWVRELKEHILQNINKTINVLTTDGIKEIYSNKLAELITDKPKTQDITYITDIAPTFENYIKAINFSKDSYILLIESVFMNNDVLHAIEKNHLSIGVAKSIYEKSNSYYVSFGHFAPKYDRMKELFFRELYSDIDKSKIIKSELIR